MRSLRPAVLLLTLALVSGTAFRCGAQEATSAPAAAQATEAAPKPAEGATQSSAEEGDQAAYLDAYLAALRAGLALTTEQDRLWPPLESAIRAYASAQSGLREVWALSGGRPGPRAPRTVDPSAAAMQREDPILALKLRSQRMLARARFLQQLADAAEPLYVALSDAQKRRLGTLLRDAPPTDGPVGRLIAALRGDPDLPAWPGCRARRGITDPASELDGGQAGLQSAEYRRRCASWDKERLDDKPADRVDDPFR